MNVSLYPSKVLWAWCYCPTLYSSFGAANVSPSLVGLPLQYKTTYYKPLQISGIAKPFKTWNCKVQTPTKLTKRTKGGTVQKPWLALSCPRMSPLLYSLYGTTRLPHTFKRLRYNTQNYCVPVKPHVLVPSATEVPLTLAGRLRMDPSPKPTQLADVPTIAGWGWFAEMSNGLCVSVGAGSLYPPNPL